VRIDAPVAERVAFLLRDYDYAIADPAWLRSRLLFLRGLHSNDTVQRWNDMITAGDFPSLVSELLVAHYDPLYLRSQRTNFGELGTATVLTADDLSPAGIDAVAAKIVANLAGT
jgi:tRNA 2-selenouridine synthase